MLKANQLRKLAAEDVLARYRVKIGFEVHCQMLTRAKLFSSRFPLVTKFSIGSPVSNLEVANSMANYIDLALPGMLPVLNKECLDLALRASLALRGKINRNLRFDRKHYFYSDLPQGY